MITVQEFKKLRKRTKRSKYGAIPSVRDGMRFHSKLEARYYDMLKKIQSTGEVLFFLRQIPFDLPGKVKYVCDYQIFWKNGDVSFIDVKGRDTPVSILKRKQVEEIYPIEIEIVKKT